MKDFFKNNKLIAGVALAILLLLFIIAFVLFALLKNRTPADEEEISFGNTDEVRVLSDEELLFGTSSEQWVTTEGNNAPAPNFRALTKTPVIGASVYLRSDGLQFVRFTSRTNGNVFDLPLETVGAETKTANETIIRIGMADWSKNAETTCTQYLDKSGEKIETYIRSFLDTTTNDTTASSSASTSPKGRHLDENIVSASLSPKGDKIFYIVKNDSGSIGFLETVATGKRSQIWSSILNNLTTSWEAQDRILIYPNPSSVADGVLWSLQPSTGKLQTILKNGLALSAKSNSLGNKILYSTQEAKTGATSLQILDLATGEIKKLGLATVSEKCVWGPDASKYVYCAIPRDLQGGKYLENWYMGITASDDLLWRLDTEVGITKMLLDPQKETGNTFDIVDMLISPYEDYLVFRTKVSSVLWSLKLTENTAPVSTATSTPQTGTVGVPL
jgi:hypothetical protein